MKKFFISLFAVLFIFQGCTPNIKTPSSESEPLPDYSITELEESIKTLPDNATFGTENFQFVTKTYGDDPQDKTGAYTVQNFTFSSNPLNRTTDPVFINEENILVRCDGYNKLYRYAIKTGERFDIVAETALIEDAMEKAGDSCPKSILTVGENHYFVYNDYDPSVGGQYCMEIKDDKVISLLPLIDFTNKDVTIDYKKLNPDFRYAPFDKEAKETTIRRGDFNPNTGLLAFTTGDFFVFVSNADLTQIKELKLYEGYTSSVQWIDDSTLYIYGFYYMAYGKGNYYLTHPFILKYNVKTDDYFRWDDTDRQFLNFELEKSIPGYTNLYGYSGRDSAGAVIVNADNTIYTIQYSGTEFAESSQTDWVEIFCANDYVGIVFNRGTKSEICLYHLSTGEFYKVLEFDKPDEFTSYRFTSVSPNAGSFLLQKSGGGQNELLLVTKK